MKKLIAEFKKFISRGSVMDMAVGVIVGSAFTAIVTALTNGILKPLINWLISLVTGGGDLSDIYTVLKPVYDVNPDTLEKKLDLTSSIYIDWGAFVTAIINFFLIAMIVFMILKAWNYAMDVTQKAADIQRGIDRKLAKGKKLNKLEKKYLEEKAQKEAAEKAAKEEAEREANKPTKTEELLQEILVTLQEEKK